MKILMIVPQPFFQSRGTPFSVYFRTRTLASMGHQVDIITYPIGRDVTIPGVRILRTIRVPFINKIKIGPSFPKLILDVPLFFKGFKQLLTNRYDLVHAHEEGVFFCLVYKLFFWRLRVLYDMHSSLPQQLRNFKFSKNPLLIKAFEWLEHLSLKSSSGVITICPALQQTVEHMKVRVPSAMIENTLFDKVDFADGSDERGKPAVDWRLLEGRTIVLYSGTFEAYQGLPMLIEGVSEVVAKRPDVVYLLVGGTPQQVAELRELAAERKVGDFVLFTGNLPPNAINDILRQSHVLVSPRIKGTNTPLKIYEYLASGRPIVATRHPTHTQILTDREAVLTECDPSSFAKGILEALNVPGRATEVVKGALELYRSAYAPDIYKARLEDLLHRMKDRKAELAGAATAGAR